MSDEQIALTKLSDEQVIPLARKAFASSAISVYRTLRFIEMQLGDFYERQMADPANWEYVGTLADVDRDLAIILAKIGDRSVVYAKRIAF